MIVALTLFHLLISVSLIGVILLQSGKGGLGRAFGGDGVYRSKRGAERVLFRITIFLGALFFVTSIATMLAR